MVRVDLHIKKAPLYTRHVGKYYSGGNCCESEGQYITLDDAITEVEDAIKELQEALVELKKEQQIKQ